MDFVKEVENLQRSINRGGHMAHIQAEGMLAIAYGLLAIAESLAKEKKEDERVRRKET